MSSIEGSRICSRQEYIDGQDKRLMPDDLRMAEVYSLMVDVPAFDRLDSLFGLKLPARVEDIQTRKNGLVVVHMAFKLVKPRADKYTYATFNHHGFWQDALDDTSFGDKSSPWARNGYFMGYEEPGDGGIAEVNTSLEEPRVLEPV